LADNTKRLYDTAVKSFQTFRKTQLLNQIWPPPPEQLVDFVAYLSFTNLSPNTVKSYIAGISYFNKIHGFTDTTQSFILKKVLLGFSRSNMHHDARKPITLDILSAMIQTLPTICKSHYESSLFSTIFTTAFFGFFRMGELVQDSRLSIGHAIQTQNVAYLPHNNTVQIILQHSKTDQQGKGVAVQLTPSHKPICPVSAIRLYAQLRPNTRGSFFCHQSGSPVTRYQVVSVFNMSIRKLGLDSTEYKTHSFRIGAASNAWASGVSEHAIATQGRWKSKCLHNYIRI
jgi:hypothetical protein